MTLGFALTLLMMELVGIWWVGRHEPRMRAWDQDLQTELSFLGSMKRSLIAPVSPEQRAPAKSDRRGRHRL
jgi:hypothetical protein